MVIIMQEITGWTIIEFSNDFNQNEPYLIVEMEGKKILITITTSHRFKLLELIEDDQR